MSRFPETYNYLPGVKMVECGVKSREVRISLECNSLWFFFFLVLADWEW